MNWIHRHALFDAPLSRIWKSVGPHREHIRITFFRAWENSRPNASELIADQLWEDFR